MKKRIKSIIQIILLIFVIQFNIGIHPAYAASNELKTFLYAKTDCILKNEYVAANSANSLYETSDGDNDWDLADVYVQREWNQSNFCIRYNWLHATKNLVEWAESRDFKQISSSNDLEYIETSIEALKTAKNEIGTFNEQDKNAEKPGGTTFVTIRAKSAFDSVVGGTHDAFVTRIADVIRKLNAAHDYKTGNTSYSEKNININDGYTNKIKYKKEQIEAYYEFYGENFNVSNGREEADLKATWIKTMGGQEAIDNAVNDYDDTTSTTEYDENYASRDDSTDDKDKYTVFKMPNGTGDAANGIQDVANDATSFLNNGTTDGLIQESSLQSFSQNIYSMLLGVGIVVAVIVGLIIGVKLMIAPLEERAEAKKLLIPYVAGCVLVFGAFGIWKLAVTLLSGV